jgi:hypothetical protein
MTWEELGITIASFDFAAEEWTIQGPVLATDAHCTQLVLAALTDCLVAVHNNR